MAGRTCGCSPQLCRTHRGSGPSPSAPHAGSESRSAAGSPIWIAVPFRNPSPGVTCQMSRRYPPELHFGWRDTQAVQVLGAYAYHFWMMAMTPIRRRSGNQYLHRKTAEYRRQVQRKIGAYHAFIQLACIAQGLLLYLATSYGSLVWTRFRSWLRTMNPNQPPSELVVAYALRSDLPEFLASSGCHADLKKFLSRYRQDGEDSAGRRRVA